MLVLVFHLLLRLLEKNSGKGAPRIGITDHSRTRRSLPSTSKKGDGIVNPYALKARKKRPGDEVAPHIPPPFIGTEKNPVGIGVKKISEEKRKRASIRQKQPVQWNPITRRNIVRPEFL